ncbi:ArpU family phage packaging/lysis transcriptional regulator [Tepidibacillus decaturensis]|uniref:ArpU family transcriptional regulator n=1 Tax=Tepidibacillus decaturensis TaxID=1413211 RepID=A0A135L1K2_9BACI|nr:ArpU family phage packaging/lysis transcriptional regulator [Tepidibacillus decaturensis]KXG42865.1 hypothetical protein U473_01590 [Tepidibacillus decaturensis]
MEQLSFLEKEIPKSLYVRKVERILYEYPALKASQENEKELEKAGLGNLFPSLISSYEDSIRGTDISNTTEKFGIKRAEKALKIMQIERALNALNHEEKRLVKEKYFNPAFPSDIRVYTSLNLGSTAYYKLKDQTIRKVATALNII